MRVRTGWSGETQSNVWQKVAIELEEEDLARMMLEHGLPMYLHERLPAVIVYELLASQADILLMRKLITLGYPQDKALSRVNELAAVIESIVTSARDKLADDTTSGEERVEPFVEAPVEAARDVPDEATRQFAW